MAPQLPFDLRGKRDFCCRSPWACGIRNRSPAEARKLRGPNCRSRCTRFGRPAGNGELARARAAGCDLSSGGLCRRHPREQHLSRRFISINLAIALNVIRGAHATGVKKLLALGSSCIYPKHAGQPMSEDMLLTGPLEPSNEWYAVAKIAAIKLCEAYRRQYGDDFISVMPTNLYGPNDNYHPLDSHVPAALIRRFHEAKLATRRL